MTMDNKALRLTIDDAIEHNQSICQLKTDVGTLKTDVATLKTDVAILKVDAADLKKGQLRLEARQQHLEAGQMRLEAGQHKLEEGQTYLGVTMESMQRDLKLVLEALIPANAKAAKIGQIEDVTQQHEGRIGALENAFKSHIANHAAPR